MSTEHYFLLLHILLDVKVSVTIFKGHCGAFCGKTSQDHFGFSAAPKRLLLDLCVSEDMNILD